MSDLSCYHQLRLRSAGDQQDSATLHTIRVKPHLAVRRVSWNWRGQFDVEIAAGRPILNFDSFKEDFFLRRRSIPEYAPYGSDYIGKFALRRNFYAALQIWLKIPDGSAIDNKTTKARRIDSSTYLALLSV
jgi:hypothetical protein